jgi:hypothetical protein
MIILAQRIQDFDICAAKFDFNVIMDLYPSIQYGICIEINEEDQTDEAIVFAIDGQFIQLKYFAEKIKQTKIQYIYMLLNIKNLITLCRILNIIGNLDMVGRTIFSSSYVSLVQYLSEKETYITGFHIKYEMYLQDRNVLTTPLLHKPTYILLDNRIIYTDPIECHNLSMKNQMGITELGIVNSMVDDQLKLIVNNYSCVKIITTNDLIITTNTLVPLIKPPMVTTLT